MRLNRYLSNAGIASRRKSEEFIKAGRVKVNGTVVTDLATTVDEATAIIVCDNKQVILPSHNRYYLLNKPLRTISAVSDDRDRDTVIDLFERKRGLHPVGRLDYFTTGALLITDDGDFTNRLTHPSFGIEREYRVTLNKTFKVEDKEKLKRGVQLDDGMAYIIRSGIAGTNKMTIVLGEGRNREVRRIFEALGYDVRSLHRKRFAGLDTKGLKPGEYRRLTPVEIKKLKGKS